MLSALCSLPVCVFASAGDPAILPVFLLLLLLLFVVCCLLSALAIALVALLCSKVFSKLPLLAAAARAAASDRRCNDIGLAIAVKRSTFAGRALATPFAMACNGKNGYVTAICM